MAASVAGFLILMAWIMGKTFDVLMELEALAASKGAADSQEAADVSRGVLEEGQADEAFLGPERGSESKANSVGL